MNDEKLMEVERRGRKIEIKCMRKIKSNALIERNDGGDGGIDGRIW